MSKQRTVFPPNRCFRLEALSFDELFFPAGNYVLTYLYNQPKLAQFVVQGLVTLFARITNLGWFDSKEDEFVFRNVIGDVTKFLQVGLLSYFLWLT